MWTFHKIYLGFHGMAEKKNVVEFIKNLIQKEVFHCLRHKEAQGLIELLFVDVDGSFRRRSYKN